MTATTLLSACLLDALAGDPRWLPHPVRLMGRSIGWYEARIRRYVHSPPGLRAAGLVLAVGLPAGAWAGGWGLIRLAELVHPLAGTGMEILLAYTTLAARDLADHVSQVLRALQAGLLTPAREAVAQIVGRDTEALSEPEIVRATVETIAESAADGIVAPLLYLAVGGAPLALAFKAVSTLDSMVGHRDERYRDFGWASARLDDGANWVPARLSAWLLVLAEGLVSGRAGRVSQVWSIVVRDADKHESPNSGWPEAAMAGSLQVQLGGRNVYGGTVIARPLLGDPGPALQVNHIRQALRLMIVASALAIGLAVTVRLA
ncbi:MAG: adenosylcobinamide-phosphate synthase CbiB [Nitrospiraceae bacterium]